MPVTKSEVEHVASLARLELSEEEKTLFTEQLSQILSFADALKKLDTHNIPPTSHAIPMKNVLREDRVEPYTNITSILANAPDEEDKMFRVPKIIEE